MIRQEQFKEAMRYFATGITVITTMTKDLDPYGITINSFSSVSLEPPLVSFSLIKTARIFEAIHTHPHFAIHVLEENQQNLSIHFAKPGGGSNWESLDYEISKPWNIPLLKGCLTQIICERYQTYEGGDHEIILGRVVDIHKTETLDAAPLVYYKRHYHKVGEEL
jgi:flavin reductase (DIM6/NTAB) family NADH-FMN oxidoreductase RutF